MKKILVITILAFNLNAMDNHQEGSRDTLQPRITQDVREEENQGISQMDPRQDVQVNNCTQNFKKCSNVFNFLLGFINPILNIVTYSYGVVFSPIYGIIHPAYGLISHLIFGCIEPNNETEETYPV